MANCTSLLNLQMTQVLERQTMVIGETAVSPICSASVSQCHGKPV
ncbi:hypothetical protein SPWS13_2425 [Shewanella putrefaciens]|nr:hypothetical protein SPWS13_2425 [Shewanella putrefaciens]